MGISSKDFFLILLITVLLSKLTSYIKSLLSHKTFSLSTFIMQSISNEPLISLLTVNMLKSNTKTFLEESPIMNLHRMLGYSDNYC